MAKVVTNKVRFSYVHVFEPYAMAEGDKKRYSVSIIIPKTDTETIKKINDAINLTAEQAKAKFGGKVPASLKKPLRDGDIDREDDEAYQGAWFMTANSNNRPPLVDSSMNAIIDPAEFYSGCYGRASVDFFAFNTAGNKGIAVSLRGLQKLEDGDRLGGSTFNAEEDFGGDTGADDLLG